MPQINLKIKDDLQVSWNPVPSMSGLWLTYFFNLQQQTINLILLKLQIIMIFFS